MLESGIDPAQGGVAPPASDGGGDHHRRILHVDMDAFYASVEQRDDPSLRGRPIAVGGSRERGVVAAASYEARAYGVRSAMPSVTARRKCPDLVFVKPRFEVYREVSAAIRAIFADYTPLIEPLSLDEAYLDVTENLRGIATATETAREIKARIRSELDLASSAGVSYNKVLAKFASGYRKPDGLFVITPRMGPDFVLDLPVGKFHGVGPATEAKMQALGIRTGADLRTKSKDFLRERFGKSADFFWGLARGIDDRPVRPDRVRKSVGAEATFEADLASYEALRERLEPILDKVWSRADAIGFKGRTVTLKVKYSDFEQITRARSLSDPVPDRTTCERIVLDLLREVFPLRRSVRLIGASLSGLETGDGPAQYSFDLETAGAHA